MICSLASVAKTDYVKEEINERKFETTKITGKTNRTGI